MNSKKPVPRQQEKLLYSLLSCLLVSEKQSKLFQYLQFLCSEIQYIAVLLWMQTSFLAYDNRDAISIYIHKLANILALRDFLEGNSKVHFLSGGLIVVWMYFACVFLLIAYMFYKATKKQEINRRVQTYISSFFQFHAGFLFWMINMILMEVISLNSNGVSFLVFTAQSGENKALIGTQLLFVLINYIIGIISALFCFDPFCSTNLFAVRTPSFQFLNFLLKALIAPIATFSSYDDISSRVIFIIIAFGISVTRLVLVLRQFPFYQYLPMKLSVIFTAIGIWLSVSNILAIIWTIQGLTTSFSIFYLIILTLPITLKAVMEWFYRVIAYYIAVDQKNLCSERQIYAKLFVHKFLGDKVKLSLNENRVLDRYEAYFVGDMVNHADFCEDSRCLCHFFLENKGENADKSIKNAKCSLSTYLSAVNASFLGEAIQRVRDKNDLKVTLADLIFTNATHRSNAALICLFGASGENIDFSVKMKRYMLVKKIQAKIIEFYLAQREDRLNILKFVDFQADSARFLSQITSVTNEYINFWDTLKKPQFKIVDLLQKSDRIEKSADKIDRLWNSYNEKYESFYHLMREPYRIYLSVVRNTPSTSSSEIKKLKWKKSLRPCDDECAQITEDDLISSKVLTVSISMVRERIGKVKYISENVQSALGYAPQELVGRSVNYMMSPFFAEKHDQLLLKHLERVQVDSQSKDYYTANVYTKTKAGHVIPCSLYVTVFPYLQKELVYCGVIKKISIKHGLIIADNRGYIDSYTEDVGKKLNLGTEKKLHMRDVCPDIDKLFNNSSKKFTRSITYYGSGLTMELANPSKFGSTETGEGRKEELQNRRGCLNFIQWNMQNKYFKYNVTLNERTVLDKSSFIFKMEFVGENKIDPRSRRLLQLNSKSASDALGDDSESDVPTERPILKKKVTHKRPMEDSVVIGDDFTETTKSQGNRHAMSRRTDIYSEWSEQLDKNTASHFEPESFTQTKIGSFEKVINSFAEIDDGFERRKRRMMSQTPKHNNRQVGFGQSDRVSTSSSITSNMNNKLETAIYTIPKDRYNFILKAILWVLILACTAMHLDFHYTAENKLEYVKENVDVMTTSSLRLFQITELNRRTRMISLLNYGYISNTRFAVLKSNTPIIYIVTAYLDYIHKNITSYNNMVRKALEKIENSLQHRLFQSEIPVYDPDIKAISYEDTIFDAATVLAVKAGQLSKTSPLTIQKDNYYVNYILNNTLNEQLVVSEEVTGVLLEDNDYKLDSLRDLSYVFMAIIFVFSALLLIIFGYNQVKTIKSRNKFIELFLRLSDEEIDQSMVQVRSFKSIILRKGIGFDDEISREGDLTPGGAAKAKASVKGFRVKRRDAELQGVNRNVFFAVVLLFSIFLAVLIPFISLNTMIRKDRKSIKKDVDLIVKVHSSLYDMNLLSVAMYEYVQWNSTTKVRTHPIGEELEAAFTRLSTSLQVFRDLLTDNKDTNNRAIDSDLELLLSGNICKATGVNMVTCNNAGTMTEQGIIGLNSFVILTLRRVKDMFDASNKTFNDGKTALNQVDLIYIEYVFTVLQSPSYSKLGNILQSRAEQKIDEFSQSLGTAAAISAPLSILLGLLIAGWLHRIVEAERIRWRKIMRKIPFEITLTNKAFKSYLVSESNHLLDSLKKSI